jgi:hypothetical protein
MFNSFKRKLLYLQKLHEEILQSSNQLRSVFIENYIQQNLHSNSKYNDPKKLNRYEYQAYSQYGEDGILQEIFKRIGTTNRFFIEFGVENGLECNSMLLLLSGWQGLWIEAKNEHVESIRKNFSEKINNGQLRITNGFITAENIERLFSESMVPSEPDLLSIDIDRNDYHVWKAIVNYKPRVVSIEYNAVLPPGVEYVVEYQADRDWDGSSHFGASLTSLQLLGEQKGYNLVGCNFSGVNAFFVRTDLVKDLFSAPFTAANHYEPPRYFLYKKEGHPRGFGTLMK